MEGQSDKILQEVVANNNLVNAEILYQMGCTGQGRLMDLHSMFNNRSIVVSCIFLSYHEVTLHE